MKSSAQILMLAIVVTLSKYSPAQNPDSVKKELKFLKGSERIDCLNSLSLHYMLAENFDSADYYQVMACSESEQQQYMHGLAESYAVRGQIEKYLFDNFPVAEAYLRRALLLYDKTPDKRNIENVYSAMWHTLHSQSKYQESDQYALKKMEWCRRQNDYRGMADMYIALFGSKFQTGEFAECFELLRKAFKLTSKFESAGWNKLYQSLQGKLYFAVGDYHTALNYFRLAFDQSMLTKERRRIQANLNIWAITELAETYAIAGKYDSAKICYNIIDTAKVHWKDLRVYLSSIGDFYITQNDYTEALKQLSRALPYHQAINDRSQVIRTQLGMAKSYLGLNNTDQTIEYASDALQTAIETFARKNKMDAYALLYKAYDKKNNSYQSNAYFRLYTTMKDSVALDQLKGRVAAVNYENQLSSLASEKIITSQRLQLQKQSLEQAEMVKKTLLAGLILIVLLAIVTITNFVLRKKKLQTEMREKVSDLEMAALRSQMNPHFIFNCLNAINHFILANHIDIASEYLIKFSKLIRLVLQTSSQKFVLLSEELETLRLYVELEQLRFKKHFEFIVEVNEDLDPESILIPPMLIQPFVENAIWHGLMQSNRPGLLIVSVNTFHDFLVCSVVDNGIGRTQSQKTKLKTSGYKKSMGVDITRNRLKLMNDGYSENEHLKIVDVMSDQGECAGTRVEITIPLQSQQTLQES